MNKHDDGGARAAALEKWLQTYHANDDDYPVLEQAAVYDGFNAGLAHARGSQWVAINSKEDLPEEEGEYWLTRRPDGIVTMLHPHRVAAEILVQAYSAWMPVVKPAPYTAGGEQTDGKEEK